MHSSVSMSRSSFVALFCRIFQCIFACFISQCTDVLCLLHPDWLRENSRTFAFCCLITKRTSRSGCRDPCAYLLSFSVQRHNRAYALMAHHFQQRLTVNTIGDCGHSGSVQASVRQILLTWIKSYTSLEPASPSVTLRGDKMLTRGKYIKCLVKRFSALKCAMVVQNKDA